MSLHKLYMEIMPHIDDIQNNDLSYTIRKIFKNHKLSFPDWRDYVTRNIYHIWKDAMETENISEMDAFHECGILDEISAESGLSYRDLYFNHDLLKNKVVKDTFEQYGKAYSLLE